MDTRILIPAFVIVAILILVGVAVAMRRRSDRLKRRFGPKHDRPIIQKHGDSHCAGATLAEREKRVETFPLRPLSPVDREAYAIEWATVRRRFVDDPSAAVGTAERLINRMMIDRGYPMADFEQRAADISVGYPAVVQNYRAAHEIAVRHADGQVTTEELHQAVIHYRTVFDELLQPDGEPAGGEPAKVQPIHQQRGAVSQERAS
jgi:hypothetical protein